MGKEVSFIIDQLKKWTNEVTGREEEVRREGEGNEMGGACEDGSHGWREAVSRDSQLECISLPPFSSPAD